MAKQTAGFIIVDSEGIIWGAAKSRFRAMSEAEQCLEDCGESRSDVDYCDVWPATQALLDRVDARGGNCGGWGYDRINNIACLWSEASDV